MSLHVIFYFLPVIFIFLVSCMILIYCKCKCKRENGEEVGLPDQATVQAFVVPAGVPEWVTMPKLLYMHNYFNSMFSLAWETALHYFPGPQLAGTTETVDLGVV